MSTYAREIKKPSEEPDSLTSLLDPASAINMLGKILFRAKLASVFDKGSIATLESQGFAGKPILTLPDAADGTLARILASVGKMRWEEVPKAELSYLAPVATGAEGESREIAG